MISVRLIIILDTNVVSELTKARPNPEVVAWWDNQNRDDLFVTAIVLAELCYGVAIMSDEQRRDQVSQSNESMLEAYFADRILPFDGAAAREYADILAHHRANKLPVDRHDCMIAAIARSYGAAVATRNVRDFADCGVPLINPWEMGGPV